MIGCDKGKFSHFQSLRSRPNVLDSVSPYFPVSPFVTVSYRTFSRFLPILHKGRSSGTTPSALKSEHILGWQMHRHITA